MAPKKKKEVAARLLELNFVHDLDKPQLLRLLNADQQPCDCTGKPCKSACKTNPNCLCQLIPAEGSFRKKGLWQKDKELLKGLGEDPKLVARKVRKVVLCCTAPTC